MDYARNYTPNPTPVGIVGQSQPVHYEVANKMAIEIFENFDPVQQNEMVKHIIGYVKEQRQLNIQDLQNKAEYLHKTLSDL